MTEELTLELPGLRLAAQAWGPAGGRPVLALHGWLDNAASFAPLAPLLAGLRVVALDLAGHGRSDRRPSGCRYHFVDNLYDVLAAADVLGWPRFALLGHSLGAAVACMVAASVPERIERLALIEGLGPLTEPAGALSERLRQAVLAEQRLAGKSLPVYADIEAAARARQRATGLENQAALLLAARGTRPVAGGVTWRSDPRLTLPSPFYLSENQVQGLLASIRTPDATAPGPRRIPAEATVACCPPAVCGGIARYRVTGPASPAHGAAGPDGTAAERIPRLRERRVETMIEHLPSVSDRVLAFRLSGKLHAADYEDFVPVIDAAVTDAGRLRLLAWFQDFHGWDLPAAWQDTLFAVRHYQAFERIALVGDHRWQQWMAGLCRPFTIATVRYFDATELDAAWVWVREGL